jgi:hypothetical protein
MTIIGEIYSLEKRARMQGLFSGVWGLASIIGPLIGGFITDHLSWRWVFYINIPFGIAAALLIGLALVEPRDHRKSVSIDYAGAITLTLLATLLLVTLGQQDWGILVKLGLLGVCALLVFVFLAVERRASEPIVPLSLFRHRIFSVSSGERLFCGHGDVRVALVHSALRPRGDRDDRDRSGHGAHALYALLGGVLYRRQQTDSEDRLSFHGAHWRWAVSVWVFGACYFKRPRNSAGRDGGTWR